MDITSEIRLQVTGFCLAYSSLLSDTLRWGCCPLWGGSHDKELREASGQQLWGAESCNNLKVNLEADHPPVKLWLDRTASLLTPEPGLVRDPEPEDPAKPCLDSWCRSCERMCLLFWATKWWGNLVGSNTTRRPVLSYLSQTLQIVEEKTKALWWNRALEWQCRKILI